MRDKIKKRIETLNDMLTNDEYTKSDIQLQHTICAIRTELDGLIKFDSNDKDKCKHKATRKNVETGQNYCQDCHELLSIDHEYVSFNATLGGRNVRLTMESRHVDIITSDNVISYDVNRGNLNKLKDIRFEDIYEG